MLDQIIISGLSGVLIVAYVMGLGIGIKILNGHRNKGLGWKDSFRDNVKGLKSWLLFSVFSLITIVIGFGLLTSILDSFGVI